MRNSNDTIAAVATAKGEGGIAVIRISGADSERIMRAVFRPLKAEYEHAKLYFGHVYSEGEEIDEVMAVLFRAPKSYTREDVCEIHCHGGSFVTGRVLEAVIKAGARPAERGEFTYRAFINGRIDMSQAEAVMQLINANGEQAARSAVRQLKGGVSSRIGRAREKLFELTTLVDAAADYPEEIDEDVTADRVREGAFEVLNDLKKCADPRFARIVSDGARVVLAGRPNVGKSSVMNALLSSNRAIVSDIPGTTRDIISETVHLGGVKVTITDTAGIRETGDVIEKLGVDRAQEALETADCVVLVLDAHGITDEDRELLQKADERYIIALNKTDAASCDIENDVEISAKTGSGIDALSALISAKCAAGEDDEKLMSLRHIACAERAISALERVNGAPFLDLMREDITGALAALGEITGEDMGENVIDGIFERFCVGK